MNFLCPQHRQQLSHLGAFETEQLALDWLNKAALFYETGQWQEACAHIGCTFELNCLRLQQEKNNEEGIIEQITLSSIFLHNCLMMVKQTEKAELCLEITQQILLRHWSKSMRSKIYSMCLQILLDKKAHKSYFQQFITKALKNPQTAYCNNRQEEILIH